jgi:DNA adenine methylase
MGSKNKILSPIHQVLSTKDFSTGIDLFSGSGVVGYLMKTMGKRVISNDHMMMASTFSKALIENNSFHVSDSQLEMLLGEPKSKSTFISTTFRGLYFSDEDNASIENIRQNIQRLSNPMTRALALSSLIRACIKRRPRGIFTYVGNRYDDGRADLQKSIEEHFVSAIQTFNEAVFDNGFENQSIHGDAFAVKPLSRSLVYIDPPYYSPRSDNEYVRRYHFVEGLARNWRGVQIQDHTQTKKFKSYPTPFTSHLGAVAAFDALFKRFRNSVIVVSYASNALPTADEIAALLGKYKENVEVIPIDHRYSFGNQGHKVDDNRNKVKEFLFVGN